jgi:hypothetical protein
MHIFEVAGIAGYAGAYPACPVDPPLHLGVAPPWLSGRKSGDVAHVFHLL